MKTKAQHLKKILQKYKEDLKYLLFVGVPAFILLALASKCAHFGDIY